MDDRTYLLGKIAALECALATAMATHPAPAPLAVALCMAMGNAPHVRHGLDMRAYTEGWLAVVTPLLTTAACDARGTAPQWEHGGLH